MNNMTSLFLAQSYQDAWEDYGRSCTRERFARWDYVILTASDEAQAEGFRAQLSERKNNGTLQEKTHYAVIPDPDGKRVGSGGATLNVLKYIAEQEGNADFSGKRILVIHSGGDSKRVPQYSALGKLFSPVPRELPNGQLSTLFDEFMIGMSNVPSRIKEGMLVLSGDVLLLFNSLQIDFQGEGAAAISFKEDVQTGKEHGVFLRGENGTVANFLHKLSVERLTELGAVNEHGKVDIDTGAVIFSGEMLRSLFGLVATDGVLDHTKFDTFVNETARLSFYGDFLYPLAENSTIEDFYQEKPEGKPCQELQDCRTAVWEALRPFRMKLLRLSPAEFIHFGTTAEIMDLMKNRVQDYECLGWSRQVAGSSKEKDVALYNSVVSTDTKIGSGCYLEVSDVKGRSVIGNNVLLSYVTVDHQNIPSDVVLHGLKKANGKFEVRIYGVHDNPKGILEENCMFLGKPLTELMQALSLREEDLWPTEEHYLWFAHLYPECDTIAEAVDYALALYDSVHGEVSAAFCEMYLQTTRDSLCSGFQQADSSAVLQWNKRLHQIVQMDRLVKHIKADGTLTDAMEMCREMVPTGFQKNWMEQRIEKVPFSMKIRLLFDFGRIVGGAEGEQYIDRCFAAIREGILKETLDGLQMREDLHFASDTTVNNLPLRVNWGGGWSDTPPYCNEKGGTVLNCAIKLNGEFPVCVTVKRLAEHKVVFDSRDMDTHGEFTELSALQDCSDPYDPFALQKAAFIACGIIPSVEQGAGVTSLEEILTRLGGGIFLSTEVTGVPKGSGLGTSSILAGACVKTIFDAFAIPYEESELYDHVLCMEQIMSTGGGWQDQVGGLTPGIKYITAAPGMHQRIQVEHLTLSKEVQEELNDRFVLIYTGQRRLARNLLRDVVGRYIGAHPDAVYVLEEIQKVSALMRFELERGNVDGFAELLSRHWELSKQLDAGSTNTCIDQIFLTIADLTDGQMISGAGGGGFLQAILKKGVTKQDVRDRLHRVFQDSGVDVWESELMYEE